MIKFGWLGLWIIDDSVRRPASPKLFALRPTPLYIQKANHKPAQFTYFFLHNLIDWIWEAKVWLKLWSSNWKILWGRLKDWDSFSVHCVLAKYISSIFKNYWTIEAKKLCIMSWYHPPTFERWILGVEPTKQWGRRPCRWQGLNIGWWVFGELLLKKNSF